MIGCARITIKGKFNNKCCNYFTGSKIEPMCFINCSSLALHYEFCIHFVHVFGWVEQQTCAFSDSHILARKVYFPDVFF